MKIHGVATSILGDAPECTETTEIHLLIRTVPDGHNAGKTYIHVLPHYTVCLCHLFLLASVMFACHRCALARWLV